jgi:MFS family permease
MTAASLSPPVALGLRANWRQFTLLVVVNAFVGAMLGLERSVLPLMAKADFGIVSATAALSFIATFGLAKALTNLLSGWLADRHARRATLIVGWIIALPIPLLILGATSWWWIVAANALLGISQGLTWSATVIMKIDLVGPRRRGLAMGLNEFAGYAALGGAGLMSGLAAAEYGLRQGAAYPGLVIVLAGLLLSLFVQDTRAHVGLESAGLDHSTNAGAASMRGILTRSLWRDRGMFSVSQAGLVNNLNDGLAWGILPLMFAASGMSLQDISVLAAAYPITWGFAQVLTGPLSDRWGRKRPIVAGMTIQGVALVCIPLVHTFGALLLSLVALGVGTALVYPTLIAAVGDVAHPSWRGKAVGVYRLWRDLGYVVGALIAGVTADALGMGKAITLVGILTLLSGVMFALVAPRLESPRLPGCRTPDGEGDDLLVKARSNGLRVT